MTLRSGKEVEPPQDKSPEEHPPKRARFGSTKRYATACWDDKGDLEAVLVAASAVRGSKNPARVDVLAQLTAGGSFTPDHAQRAVGRAIGLGKLVVAEGLATFLCRCRVSNITATLARLAAEAIITCTDLDGITARDLVSIGMPLGDAIKISRGLDE